MLLKTRGTPHLIDQFIVTRVTRAIDSADKKGYALICEDAVPDIDLSNFSAFMTNLPIEERIDMPSVYSVGTFDHLLDDDIVLISSDGNINTLYRVNSFQNFLLITERCNSNCLMCSQPPRDRDDSYLMEIYRKLIPMIPKDCQEIGLTGGEPTLLGEKFFALLDDLQSHLPDTDLHCLTNGRSFAWKNIADRLGEMNYRKLMLGIPLYSDHYQQHDFIVQARDAFDQTMAGLYNLAVHGQRIEIRIVLHKQTIPRLVRLAKFIYRNLPFVEHVTFMGLEHQGYTPHNISKLWIDPVHYMNELREAVYYLHEMGMNVSIYNSQLCLMPEELWLFNRRSISDWKNIYLKECGGCAAIEKCGGLFASGERKHSEFISAFNTIPQ